MSIDRFMLGDLLQYAAVADNEDLFRGLDDAVQGHDPAEPRVMENNNMLVFRLVLVTDVLNPEDLGMGVVKCFLESVDHGLRASLIECCWSVNSPLDISEL